MTKAEKRKCRWGGLRGLDTQGYAYQSEKRNNCFCQRCTVHFHDKLEEYLLKLLHEMDMISSYSQFLEEELDRVQKALFALIGGVASRGRGLPWKGCLFPDDDGHDDGNRDDDDDGRC